ncbi:DUF4153 domain-containing protein [Paenibacillus caui]|uniref:DUF4153 domain-containing protein n=1 Tax=Paenibacillus caui TaxID=2873927 RepID=UPI001CA8D1FE|nr:DUF4153 domain-containing protein [Paenibacillus caui]
MNDDNINGNLDSSSNPGNIGNPENPGNTFSAGSTGIPSTPGNTGGTDSPGSSGNPDNPGNSGSRESTGIPGSRYSPGNPGRFGDPSKPSYPLKASLIAVLAAALLAAVHQYFFYESKLGVSYPLFVTLFYGYMVLSAKGRMRRPDWFGWMMFAVIALLSLTFVLTGNPFFHALNFLAIPCLVFVHMAYLFGAERTAWHDIRLLTKALDHLVPQALRHVPGFFRTLKAAGGGVQMAKENKSTVGKVLIGLTIAFPLLIIVIPLLSSADGAFNELLSGFPKWLGSLTVGPWLGRLIWAFVFSVLFFGYAWGFVDPKTRTYEWNHLVPQKELKRPGFNIDPVILITVLSAVNLVYLLFVVVQFSYLFGAWQGELPDGSSYAEYARSGFFELVAVTVINFVLLIVSLTGAGQAAGRLKIAVQCLLYILIVCSAVMLGSAFKRLLLYEQAYGYTSIRFLVHAFMIFLAVLLLAAALRIRMKSLPLVKCYIIVSLLSYLLMNYIGMDRIIAKSNIDRYREGGQIDVYYLSSLPDDAVPALIAFSRNEYPEMKSVLNEKWQRIKFAPSRKWFEFNLSEYRARKALERYLGD